MPITNLPLGDRPISTIPDMPSQISVTPELQQALSLILGYAMGKRVPLVASSGGVLSVSSPRIKDVFHKTSAAPNEAYQGPSVPCTEIVCLAHPDNLSRIWVRAMTTATVNNSVPLSAGESFGFVVENLSDLRALIVGNAETLIIVYGG